jgi:membrane-bound serine protease (ClpP class)
MAIGGAILLLASLFFFHMAKPGIPLFVAYLIGLMGSVFLVVKFALWRVKATGKKGTIYLDSDQEGFQASLYPKELIGKIGHAATDLKPSGHIWVEDRTFQALSKTGYIDKGTPIEILGGHGSHLIVKPIPSPEVTS